jgi:hypothetical protein
MTTSYTLSPVEEGLYEKFKEKHWKKCQAGADITFIPNGIGNGVVVTCRVCGKTKDITDVSCW